MTGKCPECGGNVEPICGGDGWTVYCCSECDWGDREMAFTWARVVGRVAFAVGVCGLSTGILVLPYFMSSVAGIGGIRLPVGYAINEWIHSNYWIVLSLYLTASLAYSPKYDDNMNILWQYIHIERNMILVFLQILLMPGKFFWYSLKLPLRFVRNR